MHVDRALGETAKGQLKPVYVLHGTERILIDRVLTAIREQVARAGGVGLGEEKLDAKQVRPAEVLDTARSMPMFAPRRLVIVRGIDAWSSEDQESLIAYVDAPTPSTTLVLVADGALDERYKFAKHAAKTGILFEAERPKDRDVGPWLESEAKRRDVKLAPGASSSLVMAIGADLSALGDALERLKLFAGDRIVTEDDVEEIVAVTRAASVFELADAIGERNFAKALVVHQNLVAHKEHALRTLAMLVRQVRLIARAREVMDRGASGNLASALKLPPFIVQRLEAQARKWTHPQVVRALRICAETDRQLKRSRRGDARIMEEALLALTGGPGMGETSVRGAT